MPTFNPEQLASWSNGRWTVVPSRTLNGFTQDTRVLRAGDVFVALCTGKRDGHDYLTTAQSAGAAAAIVSRADPALASVFPQLVVADPLIAFQAIARGHARAFREAGGKVIGISGSCGKTSTKNLLARLLGGEPRILATEGNLNNHIGVPLTLTRIDPAVHTHAVIEAGISGPGEMAILADMIEPDCGIITLVAPAHTQELGGIEGVAQEKAVLLQQVRSGGLRVIPSQCAEFRAFSSLPDPVVVAVPEGAATQFTGAVRFTYSFTTEETVVVLTGNRRFTFRRVSRGMAQNAVLAILVASGLGVSDIAIQRALADWEPAKWRGEFKQDAAGRWLYLDFYNANPASMLDALDTFMEVAPPALPRLYVLGCMEELGAESARYHRSLGRSLTLRPQDEVFIIGDQALEVRTGAMQDGRSAARIEVVTDLAPVAARIAAFRGAVFVKGSRRYALEKALPSREEAHV